MVGGHILHGAHRLDALLKVAVGRPYNMILGVGLVYGVGNSVHSLFHPVGQKEIFNLVGATIFQLALLVNQLAQLHEHRETMREQRKARRAGRRGDADQDMMG